MDAPAAATEGPRRRPRLGLRGRIFLLTALVVLLAVGAAVAFTALLAGRIAQRQAAAALTSSSNLEESLQQLRYERLWLISSLFATDPYLIAYVAEAAESLDSRSILDQLQQSREELGFDFAIVLGPGGRVLAHTARPGAVGEDLSGEALVAAALTDFEASGVWGEGEQLYETVAVPLVQGVDLLGYLVTGFALTDQAALEVKRTSGADVVFAGRDTAGELVPVASTLGPQLLGELVRQLAGGPEATAPAAGDGDGALELTLGGERWLARRTPLGDAAGGPVGETIALTSLAPHLAPYRQIITALVVSGVLTVLLAFALTYVLARRILEPVQRLVTAAGAARRGRYDAAIPVERHDEVGELATAFNDLLRDLREQRDMEAYLAELSANLTVSGIEGRSAGSAQRRELTLLGLELRAAARLRDDEGPARAFARIDRQVTRITEAVESLGGEIETMGGHRLLASFGGDERSARALAAAAALGGAEGEELLTALTAGTVAQRTGSRELPGQAALVGGPVQQLEGLLREAAPGEILLSQTVHDELAERLQAAGCSLPRLSGRLSPLALYSLGPELAAEVTAGVLWVASPDARRRGDGGDTIAYLRPGSVLAERYEILSHLGAGGMGVVYRARDRELDDVVALKVLRADKLGDTVQVERLKDELRLARKITHPNVLRLYDLGTVEGTPYLSMEYVRGMTLRQLLDRTERLPYSAALRLARQICRGLAAVHAIGVIHRDVKPENIILEPNGNAKLMDFGIARPIQRLTPGHTSAGFILGTPRYFAPEQLLGEELDARADLYSTGVVLYELFTGTLPYPEATPLEVVQQPLTQEPRRPGEVWPEIDPRLEAVLLSCLARERDRRPESAAALVAELETLAA